MIGLKSKRNHVSAIQEENLAKAGVFREEMVTNIHEHKRYSQRVTVIHTIY